MEYLGSQRFGFVYLDRRGHHKIGKQDRITNLGLVISRKTDYAVNSGSKGVPSGRTLFEPSLLAVGRKSLPGGLSSQ
ncbi:hypothetical protein Pla110_19560 [Polystyrenella longa]|uniref:Uncharacterized protein n=1 Tax=Polystyrenella longa TaxID=2528007 RepID=A0A518CLY7_9PLAN|nr:hypothetical protein Pla110_19560 [Polystyrenella longa]